MEVLTIVPIGWPVQTNLLGNILLHTALDEVINWHLKILRWPVATQQRPSMLPLLNTTRPNFLDCILKATFRCMLPLTHQQPSEMRKLVCTLPVGFLPRLCCQICEAYGNDLTPPHPPRRDICSWSTLQLLLSTVSRCLTTPGSTSDDRAVMARAMLGPAVVVAAKMVVAVEAITTWHSAPSTSHPPCCQTPLLLSQTTTQVSAHGVAAAKISVVAAAQRPPCPG